MKRAVVIFWILAMIIVFPGTVISAEINIGVIGPLTGPAAYFGLDCLHGAEIAAKEINDEGGVVVAGTNYKVKIHKYDDEGTAAKAVAGMQRLKDRYNTSVIVQNQSACILGMLEKNEAMGVLLIGFFRHPEATRRGNKLVLRHHHTIKEEAQHLAEAATKYFKAKTYASLSDVGDFGKTSAEIHKETFDKLGVKRVANEWLDMRSQTDFRGQLTKIKGANPDVIMITAYDEATAGAIKQARELGIKTPIVVSTGFQSMGEKLTGPALLEGYLKILEHQDQIPPPPAVERYKTKLYPAMSYKEPAGPYGLSVYQQVHTIILAMKKAGTTTDAMKIREEAPLVIPVPEKYNTHGLLEWKPDGNGRKGDKIGQYRNGKLVPIK